MVRISASANRPEPIELGSANNIMLTRSQSNPGQWHMTAELEKAVVLKGYGGSGRTIICTCRGFQNHKKCWHIAWLAGEDTDDEG